MVRRRRLSLNNVFRIADHLQTDINDDIYDRWHNNKINEGFEEDDDQEDKSGLPKSSNLGYYYWIGKDYANAYREDFKDVHEYMKDQFDRSEVPRMPWRDQAAVVIGHGARDLARHFIQRWNQCKVKFDDLKNIQL